MEEGKIQLHPPEEGLTFQSLVRGGSAIPCSRPSPTLAAGSQVFVVLFRHFYSIRMIDATLNRFFASRVAVERRASRSLRLAFEV
jgi:hypothetical protein